MNDDLPQRTDRVGLLRTDESLMTMATEMANVAVWEYDFVRDSMERSANHDALYGLEWQDHWHSSTFLNATHESDRERCFSAIESCLVPGGPFQYAFDFRVIWPDHSIHWLWVKGEVIRRDSSGRGNLIRGIVLDVTDRRIKEARVEYLSRLYSALSEVNQAIVRMESEELLFPLVCRMAVDHGGMVLASVGQESAEGGLIKSVFCYGRGQDYLSQVSIATSESFPEGRGPVGTAFRENRVVVVDHFLQSEMTRPWHALARSFGWGSVAAFPIRRADRPFAVLSVYHTDEKAFDPQAIDLLDEMARDVSFALDSFDRERERVQIKGQLVASERHFRAYFERAMVGMAAATPDYRFCEVNDALCLVGIFEKRVDRHELD
jgi:PAS fold./GAF domain.